MTLIRPDRRLPSLDLAAFLLEPRALAGNILAGG